MCFPEYKGENSFEAAAAYIATKFKGEVQGKEKAKAVFSHITRATDQGNKIVVDAADDYGEAVAIGDKVTNKSAQEAVSKHKDPHNEAYVEQILKNPDPTKPLSAYGYYDMLKYIQSYPAQREGVASENGRDDESAAYNAVANKLRDIEQHRGYTHAIIDLNGHSTVDKQCEMVLLNDKCLALEQFFPLSDSPNPHKYRRQQMDCGDSNEKEQSAGVC